MFLVVFRSDVHFGFENPFFCVPDWSRNLFVRQKVGRLERNLSTPALMCEKLFRNSIFHLKTGGAQRA